ncbi:MAG: nucleotidyltransferase family protein [Nitrospirae bacterium]|nr:nucleotidyltransferase family protein [Nitrospirota bacterium]
MDAIEILRQHEDELRRQFGVKRIGVFGSFARGEQTKMSDVDVLVEFDRPVGLFEFIGLEMHLEGLLGRKVDLVTKNALKPYIKDRILEEVMYA